MRTFKRLRLVKERKVSIYLLRIPEGNNSENGDKEMIKTLFKNSRAEDRPESSD